MRAASESPIAGASEICADAIDGLVISGAKSATPARSSRRLMRSMEVTFREVLMIWSSSWWVNVGDGQLRPNFIRPRPARHPGESHGPGSPRFGHRRAIDGATDGPNSKARIWAQPIASVIWRKAQNGIIA